MKKAIFITGFNNWGKTTIIEHLFNKKKFSHNKHCINGINSSFIVESHSNDDYFGVKWIDLLEKRIKRAPNPDLNLFTALCPAIEKNNNFIDLLSNPIFSSYDKLHIFLIEYKWEHHAKLLIDNIINAGKNIQKINFVIINVDQNETSHSKRWEEKTNQIKQELLRIFP